MFGLSRERRANRDGREAFEALRDDLMNRLLPLCADWARDELEQLTAQMTRIRIRYDRDTAVPQPYR